MIKKDFKPLIISALIMLTGSITYAQSTLKRGMGKAISTKDFSYTDIGNPAIKGTVKIAGNGFDITAGGADIWGVKDEFTFVYLEHTGDFDIAARIESLGATNLYTKAGLMAREDLTAGCRHIYFQVFPNNDPRNHNNGGFEFQYRQVKTGEMKAIYPHSDKGDPEFPVDYPNTWIRLQRIRNSFTGYYSTDGKIWKIYTTFSLDLPTKIYLGPAVTSHDTETTTTAVFRDIIEIKH